MPSCSTTNILLFHIAIIIMTFVQPLNTSSDSNISDVESDRPPWQPCDSSRLLPDEMYSSFTSWAMFFPYLGPRCAGKVRLFKLYARATGDVFVGLFEKRFDIIRRRDVFANVVIYRIVISKANRWLSFAPHDREYVDINSSLGIWYADATTQQNVIPIRYADADMVPGIPPIFPLDVYVVNMNDSQLNEQARFGTLDWQGLTKGKRQFGSFMPNARVPGVIVETEGMEGDIQEDKDPSSLYTTSHRCCEAPSIGRYCLDIKRRHNESICDVAACRPVERYVPRFYYDPIAKRQGACHPMVYLGCGGTANNYDTRSSCESDCLGVKCYW